MLKIHSFKDLSELNAAFIERLKRHAYEVLATQERCHIALSGGHSPKTLYEQWGLDGSFPWGKCFVTPSDERYLPIGDADTNDVLIREHLLAYCAELPAYLPYPTDLAYADIPKRLGADMPQLDIAILGLGADAHTASVFPSDPASLLAETPILLSTSPVAPHQRISISLKHLAQSKEILFYIRGSEKAKAIQLVLENPEDMTYPLNVLSKNRTIDLFCDFEL